MLPMLSLIKTMCRISTRLHLSSYPMTSNPFNIMIRFELTILKIWLGVNIHELVIGAHPWILDALGIGLAHWKDEALVQHDI